MNWEPWTGCYKVSDGCDNCYFYGPYAKRYGHNTVEKTDKFDWPIRRNAKGEYNIKGGKILATCFASDFFVAEADEWRAQAWAMIRERTDLEFLILTKREARVCDYDRVLAIREQCAAAGATFWFKGCGSLFRRDGVTQKVNPYKQGSIAKELGIDIRGDKKLF